MELTSEDRGTIKRRRVVDTSNGDARRAIRSTLEKFDKWRLDLASFNVRVERRCSDAERDAMLRRCREIADDLLSARTELIISLADAPQKVAGHSRVVDVERALDNTEMAIAALRGKLGGTSGPTEDSRGSP